MIILNSKIWAATVSGAKAKAANSPEWLRAIERADREIQRSKYWAFDAQTGVLKLMSTTSGKLYTITADHTCEATANGRKACKHKAAHRLMLRYVEKLGVASAEGKGIVAPAPSGWWANGEQTANDWKARDDERANAPLLSPSLYLRGEKYNDIDI